MATKGRALRYLFATLTQGSADAFVQATIATALANAGKQAFILRELLIEAVSLTVANATYEFTLTRKSMSATPLITEKSLIYGRKFTNQMTTSGAYVGQKVIRETYEGETGILLVEDPLYAQLDSASSSVSNVWYVRLGVEDATVSDIDRVTLIANSLS